MRYYLFILIALLNIQVVLAQDIPNPQNPPRLVNDFAGVMDKSQEQQLENKLLEYFTNTSTQIAVVTVADLGNYDVADFAYRIGEKWGVGDSKFNNGIVVLFKPKTNQSKGQVFIATGYGLEGAVPDITSKQIVENEMIPAFRRGDIYGGIDQGTNVLIELTKGEYNSKQYAEKVKSSNGFNPFILFLLIFFVFPILFGRRRRYSGMGGRRSSLPFWLALGLFSSGRGHGGMYNDFSKGSGSFGGGNSFGGFGGFGGGSFGGGGAGGSW